MQSFNAFNITLFTFEEDKLKDLTISIYANNSYIKQNINEGKTMITFYNIIVPKYANNIHMIIKTNEINETKIYNILNKSNNYKIKPFDTTIFIKIRHSDMITDDNITFLLLKPNKLLTAKNTTYIYNRTLKTIIPEIQYNNNILNYISNKFVVSYLRKIMTFSIGIFLKSRFSKFMITDYIKKYHINISQFDNIYNFTSFNDFFTRHLLLVANISVKNKEQLLSPATCRMLCYENIDIIPNNMTLWIKGSNFTINNLLNVEETEKMKIKTAIICRLACNDYHHFHMPLTGKLINIKIVGNDYLSVLPQFVNSTLNVLTENYRQIYHFESIEQPQGSAPEIKPSGALQKSVPSPKFNFYIIAIGSFIVGSIEHIMKIGQTYTQGTRIGNFSLGGSTIIILSEQQFNIHDDLKFFTNNRIETYVNVIESIGSIKPIIETEQPKYPKYYNIDDTDKTEIENNTGYNIWLFIIIIIIIIIYYIYSKKR